MRQANEEFIKRQEERFPDVRLRIRSGIYRVAQDCLSASAAIDAANFARKQVSCRKGAFARLYDESLSRRQTLETEIINGLEKALNEGEFQLYLQPKFSLKDSLVTGAEALSGKESGSGTAPVSHIGEFFHSPCLESGGGGPVHGYSGKIRRGSLSY